MLHILYFARLREVFGCGAEDLPCVEGMTVADLLRQLAERGEVWRAELTGVRVIRVAVNQELVAAGHCLRPGDEVAIFPPVTGG